MSLEDRGDALAVRFTKIMTKEEAALCVREFAKLSEDEQRTCVEYVARWFHGANSARNGMRFVP